MSSPIIEFDIQPRFYETDALGHINNVAITGWLELGRTRLIEALSTTKAPLPADSWVVVSISTQFVAETFYGDDVTLRITAIKFGNTSLTIDCELWQSGRVTVRGQSVLVHRDPATGVKRELPESLKQTSTAAPVKQTED